MPFDFSKNQIVESTDAVPEEYRGVYVEITEGDDAGKFGIAPFARKLVDDNIGLNSSLAGARKDKKSASDESASRRQSLKAYEDIMDDLGLEEGSRDAEGLKAYIEDIRSKAKNGEELKVNLDKVRDEMGRKHAVELEGKDKEISKKDAAISKFLISDAATRALAEHKGSVDLLLPHVKAHAKTVIDENEEYVVRITDAQGDVRYNGAGQPMTIGDLVKEMKDSDKFARAFDSEQKGGGGMQPGSGKRPTPRRGEDMSSTDKIAAGLQKGQHKRGRG